MKCVLLSGGGGLRLWPLSRKNYPKQFLKLADGKTLFSSALARNLSLTNQFMIITNEKYRYMTANEIDAAGEGHFQMVLETVGRNTAPAMAMAAFLSNPDDVLFVAPTDALISDLPAYNRAILEAETLAEAGSIVTFGIRPTSPHTGYGYIKYHGNDVESFKEKPDRTTAERYLKEGTYLWNSGMFMFKAGVFLEELSTFRADIYSACMKLAETLDPHASTIKLPEEGMRSIPSESVDYAVIEKSSRIKVVPADFYWNDVGGLEAFSDMTPADDNENRSSGENIITSGCKNVSIINETDNMLVVANDLQDLIVTNTNNAVYVTKKGTSQKIKEIIGTYDDEYGSFFDENVRTYRPWGNYEVLVSSPHYKVKRITVSPGKQLSLQLHHHRSEHWTIAKGTVEVTLGQETVTHTANQSTYIPIGVKHRLKNPTNEEAEIIEVSIGDYIGEDDIERFEDDFGRANK